MTAMAKQTLPAGVPGWLADARTHAAEAASAWGRRPGQ